MRKFGGLLRFFVTICAFLLAAQVVAKDKNFTLPIEEIEHKLRYEPFKVRGFIVGARFDNDFTKRATLQFEDGAKFKVKWKRAEKDGDAPNNSPRYEIAAYEFQKLFLDPENYCVPPTIGRSMPLEEYRQREKDVKPTFGKTSSVFFVLQYWLKDITSINVYDKKRFKTDLTYAKHLGNTNIFTYLIKHLDSNTGNFLVSIYGSNMRVFSVDNGLAFGTQKSNRGTYWKDLRLKRLPGETIERLRRLKTEDIKKALGVVAQFEIKEGQLVPAEPGENLDKGKGVRQKGSVIQFGLTEREIKGVLARLENLLNRVDSGKIETF